jgi:prevent-host-death family protein
MSTISIEEAQAKLPELVAELRPGEELVIVQHNREVARLVGNPSQRGKARQPGSAIGELTIVADDDIDPRDFGENMP